MTSPRRGVRGSGTSVALEDDATVQLGRGPGFPLFSPDSSKLYVLNSGSGDVAVIDMKTRAVTARYKVGTDPFGGFVKTR